VLKEIARGSPEEQSTYGSWMMVKKPRRKSNKKTTHACRVAATNVSWGGNNWRETRKILKVTQGLRGMQEWTFNAVRLNQEPGSMCFMSR